MKKAIIRIVGNDEAILSEAGDRFKKVWKTGKQLPAVFTFNSPAQLFSVISPKRWELVERLQHLGPNSIRALARSLNRDVKRVHDDVMAMIDWGLVERNAEGQVLVPYDVIHATFDLKAVA